MKKHRKTQDTDSRVSPDEVQTREPRLHPNEVRILSPQDVKFKEIIPQKLYMRHWFGTNVSIAIFRLPQKEGEASTKPDLHHHGTELVIQKRGSACVEDAVGRRYSVREGDVYIIRAGVPHTGEFFGDEAVVYSIVTPPRAEYPPESEEAYWPGKEDKRIATIESREVGEEPTVRVLFNINDVLNTLWEIIPDQLYHRHWHGDDISVSVTRMVRGAEGKHFPAAVNVHGEEVTYAIKGNFEMEIDGSSYPFQEGQLLIIPPYMPHTGECLDDDCVLMSWFTPGRKGDWGDEDRVPTLKYVKSEEQ